jgi:protoporphyrinogen IX oxidase
MYFYVKALHIIFVVTWFAGLFYMVRLFIYNREAQDKSDVEKKILQKQFAIMIQRLWFGIAWPSCILTVIFGTWMLLLYGSLPVWLMIKIGFVIGLLLYHFSLQIIYKQQKMGVFKYTSNQLRIWNEGATVFLIAIVMLVSVKTNLSFVWGILGLAAFTGILLAGIKIYRKYRKG